MEDFKETFMNLMSAIEISSKAKAPPFHLLLDDEEEERTEEEVLVQLSSLLASLERTVQSKVDDYIGVIRRKDDNEFIRHLRLSRPLVYELIEHFEATDIFRNLQGRGKPPISAERHILTFLWFISHQTSSYSDVADRFGITTSTLFEVISRVLDFFILFGRDIIHLPTPDERRRTEQYFRQEKRFPGVIGCIDGTHIKIDQPKGDSESYVNRKKFFSIQVQAVVNHEKKIMHVWIGYPGSVHDARVFRESDLPEVLPQICTDGTYLVGDSAYPCLTSLLVPYRDTGNLTRAQKRFNQRLSSCRVVVENAFGLLKQRFRQLYHCKLRNLSRIVKLIYVACVLHNLAEANHFEITEPPLDQSEAEAVDQRAENIIVLNDDFVIEDDAPGNALRNEVCRQVMNM